MRGKIGLAALLLSVLFWAPGVQAADSQGVTRVGSLTSTLLQPASVTVPVPEAPITVTNAAAANSRGWFGSDLAPSPEDLTDDVLAAYTLAVAVSPPECHITTPILAAIGQVESGNLANHTLDEGHRVSPEILGPVLDGEQYRAVADTDGGAWDGNEKWDRALGPMQIIPSTWRVVGLDMDGDGLRDPQNIYDAAGAAMVYLCAGGRDLSSADGLREAVLSYNASPAYLTAVLEWVAVFANADLDGTGAVPFVAALEMPVSSAPLPEPPVETRVAETSGATPTAAPQSPRAPGAAPSTSTPKQPATGTTTPAGGSGTPTTNLPGTPGPTPSSTPDPSPGPTPGSGPSDPATDTPAPGPNENPGPSEDPTPPPLPECPIPDPDATDTAEQAEPAADELVVSPETCTPPEGYEFDPETDELVVLPVTPAP